eukprot:scaffold77764_cov48-Attheya_sp.AAC.1
MALQSAAAMLESEVNTGGRVSSIGLMLSDKNPISCAGSAAAAQHGPAGSSLKCPPRMTHLTSSLLVLRNNEILVVPPNNALLAVENEG